MITTRPKTDKALLLIIVLLLLANIAGIIFNFTLMKKRNFHKEMPMDRKAYVGKYLKDELKFTDAQLKQYDSLADLNKIETKPLFDSLFVEKEKRMKFLASNNYSDSALQQAVIRSSERQKALDLSMLSYYKKVREICNESQKQKFDSNFFDIMRHKRADIKSPKSKK